MFQEYLLSPLEIVLESEERPWQVTSCIGPDETWKLDLKERRENEDLKAAYLLCWNIFFYGRLFWFLLSWQL